MKTLIINFKNSSVELDDNDDLPVEEYTEKISKILDNNNITIIHATSGSIIVRPNEVTSIVVFESEEDEYSDETSETFFEIEPEDPPQEEIHEDIITD